MSDRPRIVTLDIETAPLESYHWGLWDQNIGLEQINVEWSVLSVAWKPLGKKCQFKGVWDFSKQVRNDKPLCEWIREILDRTDIVVAQNGKAFDMRKLNARMIMHGIPPYSPVKIVDTMLASKKHFDFTSNKLAWTSKYLCQSPKSEHRRFPGFELWKEVLKGNPAARAEMRKYNIRDVVATEQKYLRLRPWMEGHPNVAAYNDAETLQCPKCGGDVMHYGYALTQSGKYDRFKCNSCGGFSRSRYTKNAIEKRKLLLSN